MMGRGDHEQAENILGNCTTLLVTIAVLLTVVVSVFGQSILMTFGASEDTIGYAWEYMQIYALGTIFVQLALGLNAFSQRPGLCAHRHDHRCHRRRVQHCARPHFHVCLRHGGARRALATILSQAVSCVWILWFLTGGKSTCASVSGTSGCAAGIFLPAVALGLSPFIMQFTESVLNVCFNTSLQHYGGRHSGRRHDHFEFCHAVYHAAFTGPDAGRSAHCQLLTTAAGNIDPRQKDVLAAAAHRSHLRRRHVGAVHAGAAAAESRHFYRQRRAGRVHPQRHAHLHGGELHFSASSWPASRPLSRWATARRRLFSPFCARSFCSSRSFTFCRT